MTTSSATGSSMLKNVQPKERIINDNDSGVDYLGHTLYAEAIAQTIVHVEAPITIGVFGRWGSGKTFLIKDICNILKRRQGQQIANTTPQADTKSRCGKKFSFRVLLLAAISLMLLVAGIIVIIPQLFVKPTATHKAFLNVTANISSTSAPATTTHIATAPRGLNLRQSLSIATLVVAGILAIAVFVLVYFNNFFPRTPNLDNLRLLAMCALSKMPVRGNDEQTTRGDLQEFMLRFDDTGSVCNIDQDVENRYLFVNFNAWACAGADNLWAGIATALVATVEAEFGKITTRLTRLLEINTVQDQTSYYLNQNHVFARLGESEDIAESIVKSLGVVTRFVTYEKWRGSNEPLAASASQWWVVTYASTLQASSSYRYLNQMQIPVSYQDPFAMSHAGNQDPDADADENTSLVKKKANEKVAKAPVTLYSLGFLLKNYSKKSCNVALGLWLMLLIFLLLFPIPLTIYANMATAAIPAAIQVAAWLPGVAAAIFGVGRFAYAMWNSQNSRINSALKGTRATLQAQLGVMNQIKYEITHITKLVQCAQLSHKKKYKIVIVIDDLDKIVLSKVKAVLDAVSILLSDRYSPFVCLISVNSRVAVESIEHAFGIAADQASISAQKYLRKIINLPFCVPVARKKKQYIGGLIDQADVVHNTMSVRPDVTSSIPTYLITPHAFSFSTATVPKRMETPHPTAKPMDDKAFLFACRKYFFENSMIQDNLEGNPRMIKRIFNIVTLTATIMNHHENTVRKEKYINSLKTTEIPCSTEGPADFRSLETAADLVCWTILTEQWPYKMSYILQVIDDSDERVESGRTDAEIPDDMTLIDIYRNIVVVELHENKNTSLTNMDADADVFYNFLSKLHFDKREAKIFACYTINLDHGIKVNIAQQRHLADIAKQQQKVVAASPSGVKPS